MPRSLAPELQHGSPCVLPTPASHTPGPGQDGSRHCSWRALGGPSTLSSAGSPLGNSWRSHALLRALFPLFDLSGLISP